MADDPDPVARTDDGRLSRRRFIQGAIAAGATASAASYVFRGSQTISAQVGSRSVSDRLISLNVNGQVRRVDVMNQDTLAMTLRYRLGLTGTKLGCDRAECGSCTVLIDDVPFYSCSVLTHSIRSRAITTIEGLASANGDLHPVQHAVVAGQGFQCAFCMPGFIMATVGYLKTNPAPTRRELAHALSGNLCRCADYNKILNVMMQAADNLRRA